MQFIETHPCFLRKKRPKIAFTLIFRGFTISNCEYMDKKTEGAWIVHHASKLQTVSGEIDFQELDFAGKCGVLLSALAADSQSTLPTKKVEAIAKGAKLNVHTDLPAILTKLERQQLIETSASGVEVLGLTTSAVLSHTSDIFQSTEPSLKQSAAIAISEETSKTPVLDSDLKRWTSDTFHLAAADATSLLDSAATIGFIDSQALDAQKRLFFNGNLFRVDNAKKCEAILNSLSAADKTNMQEVEALLLKKGCIEEDEAKSILGSTLFDKLHSIGIFDINSVNNDKETTYYITRPGAFAKYGNTLATDALDLAKAFVASLTYGMTKSAYGRGKILMIRKLMDKLIRGETLNPSTAAGQDYRILELRGVVEVRPADQGMFTMRLLKKEVGEHAKAILLSGDASTASLPSLPGASLVNYTGPEENRSLKRKRMKPLDKTAAASLLNDLRTGAFR